MSNEGQPFARELLDKAFTERIAGRNQEALRLERHASTGSSDFSPDSYARHLLACAKRCAAWMTNEQLNKEFFFPAMELPESPDITVELWATRAYAMAIHNNRPAAQTAFWYTQLMMAVCANPASLAYAETLLGAVQRSLALQ